MKTFEQIADSIGDYTLINQQLNELARNDFIVHRIQEFSEQAEWDIIRALKTALVLMAAQRDAIAASVYTPPPQIILCTQCPHRPK